MKSISVNDLAALGDNAAIVDVREDGEFAEIRVPGAQSVPLSRFAQSLNDVPAQGTVYVMCAAGGRSAQATTFLEDQGYDAVNVTGGITEWHRNGHPVNQG